MASRGDVSGRQDVEEDGEAIKLLPPPATCLLRNQILNVASRRRVKITSNIVRDTNTAVNTFEMRPKNRVVANPLIGPEPNWNRKAAAMSDYRTYWTVRGALVRQPLVRPLAPSISPVYIVVSCHSAFGG